MVCPYCGKIMENGYIKSTGYDLFWIKSGFEDNLARKNIYENGFFIADKGFVKGTQAQAYFCRKCQIVIIGTEENKV